MNEANRRSLVIYLNDHHAGGTAGRRLARRVARENKRTPWAAALADIADQIAEDERTLDRIRDALDIDSGTVKAVLGGVMETVSRLKANGRLLRYSPTSRILELETLIAGVHGKLRLWVTLGLLAPGLDALAGFDFRGLEDRASRQLEALSELHAEAVRAGFGMSESSPAT